MRTVLGVVAVLLVLAGASDLRAAGKTECKFGNVTKSADKDTDGYYTITFDVIFEIDSNVKELISTTVEPFHVTLAGDNEVSADRLSLTSLAGNVDPEPGDGAKTHKYTVKAKNNWDLRFEAKMRFTDKQNMTKDLKAETKRYKVAN